MAPLPQFNAPQATATADFAWFVYGSTLDFDAFQAWCEQHGYTLPDVKSVKPARLPGWRLAFNVRSNFWGGVVASVVPQDGSTVEGVLIPLKADALGFVRHKEGMMSGLFEEKTATCEVGGEKKPCLVYTANPSRVVPESAPAPKFLATLVKGARERGLSAEWIAALEKLAG
jgi:gamma-glutamylcyclotransferase